MKIVFFGEKNEDWEKDYVKAKLANEDFEFVFVDSIKDAGSIDNRDADIISVFVDSDVSKEAMDSLPKLKFITTQSTGFDHIDLNAAKEKNIPVSNVPAYGAETVAEHAFALLLTLSRKIYLSYDRVRHEGSFSQDGLTGFDLEGKTIGIIGTGKIGKNAARIAMGFNMKLLAHDPYPDQDFAKQHDMEYVELERLLAESDVITIHVPYMKETHHLLNKKNIPLIKKGAVLINTARGPILETQALVEALESGQLAGAGLDVLEEEGVISNEQQFILSDEDPKSVDLKTVLADHVLIDMPNVIITPHNAFNTVEARKRIFDTTIQNIKKFTQGEPQNVVN